MIIFHRAQQGDQGNQWLNGQVTLRSSAYYRLLIEGVIGKTTNVYFLNVIS